MSEPSESQPSKAGLKLTVSPKDLIIIGLLACSLLMSAVTLGVVMAGSSKRSSSTTSNSLRVDEPVVELNYVKVTGEDDFRERRLLEGGFEIKNGLLITKYKDNILIEKFPDERDTTFRYRLAKE